MRKGLQSFGHNAEMTPCIMQRMTPVMQKNHSHLRKYTGAVFAQELSCMRAEFIFAPAKNTGIFRVMFDENPPRSVVVFDFGRECF